MEYPKERNLDGIYFRIKRNDHWCDICFTDLTADEKESVMKDRSIEWMEKLACNLADVIREIGDLFDVVKEIN